jgi:hypothetical protein
VQRERKKGTLHTRHTREDPSTFSSPPLYFRVSKKKKEKREKKRERKTLGKTIVII